MILVLPRQVDVQLLFDESLLVLVLRQCALHEQSYVFFGKPKLNGRDYGWFIGDQLSISPYSDIFTIILLIQRIINTLVQNHYQIFREWNRLLAFIVAYIFYKELEFIPGKSLHLAYRGKSMIWPYDKAYVWRMVNIRLYS